MGAASAAAGAACPLPLPRRPLLLRRLPPSRLGLSPAGLSAFSLRAGLLSAAAFSGRDDLAVSVFGCEERILLTARFDNLGKGASGAAIQNLNLLLDADETAGLVL